MTTDVRPPGLNLRFRPGTTITFTIEGWAPGSLVGRTFEAKLGSDDLDLTIDDDIITIVADNLITDNYPTSVAQFVMNEEIDGTMEPIIIGKWTPSLNPRETVSSFQTFQVAIGAVDVTVSVSGDTQILAHTSQRVLDTGGTHGVVRHEWQRDGWTPFSMFTVNADGAQSFTKSVNGRRGRFTGSVSGSATAAGPGNRREFNVRGDTDWANSEIRSIWYGPNFFSVANQTPTRRPQMGHVHRFQQIGGRVFGIVAWFNIFLGPNPEVLNLNLWEGDGTTLTQGSGGTGGSLAMVDRSALVTFATRIDAFDVAQLRVAPSMASMSIPNGAFADITGMTDTTFNDPATVAIASAARASGVVTANTTGAHGLVTGDWVNITGTPSNVYTGVWQTTVSDSDTFTFTQQSTDSGSLGTGTMQKLFVVNGSGASNGFIQVHDRVANNNTDKTAGGFFTPHYPWKVFPYWVASRLVDNTLSVKQWGFGNPEPDWGDASVVSQLIAASTANTGFPTGAGLCGIVCAHAHDNDYGEYGDIEFRKL